MPIDADALKVATKDSWAKDETDGRETPEDVGIERDQGWGQSYSQLGGSQPERTVWNQLLCELYSAFRQALSGGPPQWDADLNYPADAYVTQGSRIYRSTIETGPSTANAEEPGTGQVWRVF